jgi:hypothetical protein
VTARVAVGEGRWSMTVLALLGVSRVHTHCRWNRQYELV